MSASRQRRGIPSWLLVGLMVWAVGCVAVDDRDRPSPPPESAGDLLMKLPQGRGLVAQDVALKAIFIPAEDSSEKPQAFVIFRDGRKPRALQLGDELELPSGKTAVLRGLQRRTAFFEVEGRRETLTMPPLIPVSR